MNLKMEIVILKLLGKNQLIDKKYIKIFKDKEKTQKLILDLDKYNELEFELLLAILYILFNIFSKKKIKSYKIKTSRNSIFLLDKNKKSLNQILKYLQMLKINKNIYLITYAFIRIMYF